MISVHNSNTIKTVISRGRIIKFAMLIKKHFAWRVGADSKFYGGGYVYNNWRGMVLIRVYIYWVRINLYIKLKRNILMSRVSSWKSTWLMLVLILNLRHKPFNSLWMVFPIRSTLCLVESIKINKTSSLYNPIVSVSTQS